MRGHCWAEGSSIRVFGRYGEGRVDLGEEIGRGAGGRGTVSGGNAESHRTPPAFPPRKSTRIPSGPGCATVTSQAV